MKLVFQKHLLIFAILLIPTMAFALSLDAAKSSGAIGETPTGYLEAVSPNPSADVVALVKDINGKRKAQYESIAKKNGTGLKAVEALAGKKAIEKTPPGEFVKLPNGSWKRK